LFIYKKSRSWQQEQPLLHTIYFILNCLTSEVMCLARHIHLYYSRFFLEAGKNKGDKTGATVVHPKTFQHNFADLHKTYALGQVEAAESTHSCAPQAYIINKVLV
jgi:hypothetical protein